MFCQFFETLISAVFVGSKGMRFTLAISSALKTSVHDLLAPISFLFSHLKELISSCLRFFCHVIPQLKIISSLPVVCFEVYKWNKLFTDLRIASSSYRLVFRNTAAFRYSWFSVLKHCSCIKVILSVGAYTSMATEVSGETTGLEFISGYCWDVASHLATWHYWHLWADNSLL